jgi:hypothetical protein
MQIANGLGVLVILIVISVFVMQTVGKKTK